MKMRDCPVECGTVDMYACNRLNSLVHDDDPPAGFDIVPIRVSETCQNIYAGHVKCTCMVIRRTCPFFATCN